MTTVTNPSSSPYVTVQLGHYNLKTTQWVAGLGYPRTGDKSIDGSWVWFEVVADNPDHALEEVKQYVQSTKAKFTGMHVVLKGDRVAVIGHNKMMTITY